MGRVKSLAIKRSTRKLVAMYPEKFSGDFDKNQEILSKMIDTEKKNINKIAGYIARIMKKEEKKEN